MDARRVEMACRLDTRQRGPVKPGDALFRVDRFRPGARHRECAPQRWSLEHVLTDQGRSDNGAASFSVRVG